MSASQQLLARIPAACLWILLISGAAIMALPFLWMTMNAFMTDAQVQTYPPRFLPSPPTLSQFKKLIFPGAENAYAFRIRLYYWNSTVIAAISVSLSMLFALYAAYAFAVYTFPLQGFFLILVLGTLVVPFQVTMIPLYVFISKLQAIDTHFGILAPNLASATGVLLLMQGIKTVPQTLIDAARIDGAGEIRIVLQIVAPCVKATLATATFIVFWGNWNSFLWPMIVIHSESLRTLPVALAFFQGSSQLLDEGSGSLMAASVLSLLPIVIMYAFTQKYMIKGMTLSGLK